MTSTVGIGIPLGEVIAAARELARAGRWRSAARLLDATRVSDARDRGWLAVAAVEVAVESDWYAGTATAAERLAVAEEMRADLEPGTRWDLAFLRLRHEYRELVMPAGRFAPGPDGKDPDVLAGLRRHAHELHERAPDEGRRGWAEMYLGLIADNLYGEREVAPAHYEAALLAGESGDDLLVREALRHLGDHDHDRGDHEAALDRWARATELGARAGGAPRTLAQQLLLAVLARDAGDEAGAALLAREIARWAEAIGATVIAAQATAFLAGVDLTAPPES